MTISNAFRSSGMEPCIICNTPTSNDPAVCSSKCEADYNERLVEKAMEERSERRRMEGPGSDSY